MASLLNICITSSEKSKSICQKTKVISSSTIFLSLFLIYIINIQTGNQSFHNTNNISNQFSIVLLHIWLFAFWSIGDSIKCWVCRSDGDPKCADPFDNKSFPITDCKIEKDRKHLGNLKATMCRKVRQKGKLAYPIRSNKYIIKRLLLECINSLEKFE